MKNKTGLFLLHLTGCVAFMSIPVLLSPDVSWNLHFVQLAPFQKEFLTYLLILGFFYLNHFYLFPAFYFHQRYLLYALLVAGAYLLVIFVPAYLVPGTAMMHPPGMEIQTTKGFPMPPPPGRNFRWMPRTEYVFQFLIALIFSALVRIRERLRQAEKEKIDAELSYLKAQINPHFLFNTLNSIYSEAIRENADGTASAIVKLSGMMRFVISEAHHDFVSLQKELDYISDYIELQKMRLRETTLVVFETTGISAGKRIAPLLLITFIENAFKHGIITGKASPINISIRVSGNILTLEVSNLLAATAPGIEKSSIGIENTRNRLRLLYPSSHELDMREEANRFIVHLTITLR
ncbi:MAG: sensor histidine kinase [Bacteroidota bacterium]|nr:sensor histidine kinase [Bacteroidota bacterium]